ncbi:hypothetical protein [Paraliobacillus zengyii]|nr:hypothetical protein [Paraliobacillus zengyii]
MKKSPLINHYKDYVKGRYFRNVFPHPFIRKEYLNDPKFAINDVK